MIKDIIMREKDRHRSKKAALLFRTVLKRPSGEVAENPVFGNLPIPDSARRYLHIQHDP
jgi:hypothetical protein